MEEYVERGQLTGLGSPGRWWQNEQKWPRTALWPAIVLTAHMRNGNWQPEMSRHSKVYYFWNAFTQSLLTTFTTLSHAFYVSSPPSRPLFAVSNCVPPASEMNCQPWKGLSIVCQAKNRLGVTSSKKGGGKMAQGEAHRCKVCLGGRV